MGMMEGNSERFDAGTPEAAVAWEQGHAEALDRLRRVTENVPYLLITFQEADGAVIPEGLGGSFGGTATQVLLTLRIMSMMVAELEHDTLVQVVSEVDPAEMVKLIAVLAELEQKWGER